MSQNSSSRNLTAALALVILISLAVASWPFVSPLLSSETTRVTPELRTIRIDLPFAADSVTLNSLELLGILTGITVALVIGGGLAFSAINALLFHQVSTLKASEAYQANEKSLAKLEKERVNNMRVDRTTHTKPEEHDMPRWSALSTSLVILMFVIFFGMYLDGALVPSGEFIMGGSAVNSALLIVGSLVAVTAVPLVWFMRPRFMDTLEESPGDFIWVLASGLLIVGLGLVLVVYLNAG